MRSLLVWLYAGAGVLSACDAEEAQAPTRLESPAAGNQLTAEEMRMDAPADGALASVSVKQAKDIQVEFLAEGVYPNGQGQPMIDLLEQDYAYLAVQLRDGEGRPIAGAKPELDIAGESKLVEMFALEAGRATGEYGVFEFAVMGGPMNLDRLTARVGDAKAELLINVISLEAAGFPSPATVEGALPWQTLAQANIGYHEDGWLRASFPESVAALDGTRVKLAGFMMPLQAEARQKHFLLTSAPPSCFFHIPGGPGGAVEVFSDAGVAASWELLVLAGRLKIRDKSDNGVIYQMRDVEVLPQ